MRETEDFVIANKIYNIEDNTKYRIVFEKENISFSI